ncbi:hypothetical protein BBI17_008007 [Phytophthora kernoviae]|uniref:Protein kinase domain-containing protein n=2 Tax=Phytophthora kernoviae TaxID=325452 RepID=A0A421F4W8_9STRA|nr:hypothetical protein G195_009252 [Phytophthora kernoviae 00238/432]KAG2515756.1 hypothetical protein JM16_007718 [Phytophthora kernoviae]KAG2518645.1 hypothetical protein JM18_007638 [Phytophthora kernoviae]RLN21411.1 hypothetical protein BBI17_008007 [Phytophthora kernoviae]
MMASVEHPRIVRFIGVAWDSLSDLCAVSEFMGGGDLHSLLTRFEETEHRPHGFDFEKARIALQTAQALAYLHSLDPIVLHRDLKSMNILLTPKLDAKITDFGVSRQWSVDTMTAGVGTVLWMAPEVMLGKHYDSSADIFSFGIVLSELDSHLPPYREVWGPKSGRKISDTALLQLVSSGQLSIEFSSNAPQELVDLGHACVDLDPTARPSANEVLYQLQLILQIYEAYTIDWGRRINHQHFVRYDHRTSFIQCDGFQVRVVDNNFCTRFIGHYACTIFHNVGSCFDYIFTNTYTNVKYSDAYKRAFSHTCSDSFNGNYCANNLFEQQQCQRI